MRPIGVNYESQDSERSAPKDAKHAEARNLLSAKSI